MDNVRFLIKNCRHPYSHVNSIERQNKYYLPCHSHPDFWQVIVVTEGELTVTYDGICKKMYAGDAHILPPGYCHSLESSGYRQVGIDFVNDNQRFDTVYRAFGKPTVLRSPSILEYARKAEASDYDDPAAAEYIFTLCDLILLTMARCVCENNDPLRSRILEYISRHPDGCKLNDAAAELYISSSHLERKCRDFFGIGFAKLSAGKRFELACVELSGTLRSVNDISESLGFSKVSNFSAFFKRFAGVSPAQYRKRYYK